jgi:hypothetical protein
MNVVEWKITKEPKLLAETPEYGHILRHKSRITSPGVESQLSQMWESARAWSLYEYRTARTGSEDCPSRSNSCAIFGLRPYFCQETASPSISTQQRSPRNSVGRQSRVCQTCEMFPGSDITDRVCDRAYICEVQMWQQYYILQSAMKLTKLHKDEATGHQILKNCKNW